MNFICPGGVYKWLSPALWVLTRKENFHDSFFWIKSSIEENDLFLLLEYDFEIREVASWEVKDHKFKILFEEQVWNLDIIIDLNDDHLLQEFFEIIC